MSSEKSYCEAQQIYPKQVYVDKTLIECHRLEEKVKIKNGTKKIASTAFCSSKVNEVTLPDSVEEIEPHAFFNCQDLHRITFGKNIKTIEKDSFINCPNIHEIVFPENADMIHEISRPYNQKRYDPMKYSFMSLIKSAIKSEIKFVDIIYRQSATAEKEMLKELDDFLDSRTPKLTVKLTRGTKSIWLPKYIAAADEILIENTIISWITLGYDNETAFNIASNASILIGMAVEVYVLAGNMRAEMYLKNYITDIVDYLLQMGDDKALIGIINLGLIECDKLNSVLKILINAGNTTVAAYVLMQMKDKKVPIEQNLML